MGFFNNFKEFVNHTMGYYASFFIEESGLSYPKVRISTYVTGNKNFSLLSSSTLLLFTDINSIICYRDTDHCEEYLLDGKSPTKWQWFDVPYFK